MAQLYDFNHQLENWAMQGYQPGSRVKARDLYQWGGPMEQRLALAVYTIAFLCLLHVDEALNIQVEHISMEDDKVTLTLPFRKTHQFGGELNFLSSILC